MPRENQSVLDIWPRQNSSSVQVYAIHRFISQGRYGGSSTCIVERHRPSTDSRGSFRFAAVRDSGTSQSVASYVDELNEGMRQLHPGMDLGFREFKRMFASRRCRRPSILPRYPSAK
jgi:hypothetical protein